MAISTRIPKPNTPIKPNEGYMSPPPSGLGWCLDLVNGKNCKFLFARADASGRMEYICMNQPPVAGYKNAMVTPFDGKHTLAHWCGNYAEDSDSQSPIQITIDS